MKKLTSLVAMLMMVSTSAFAQFANAGASSTSSAANTDAWQGVTASYNMLKLSYDGDGVEDLDLNGFSIGYVKAFSISKSLPLFVETGLNFTYATGEEKYSDYDEWYDNYYGVYITNTCEQKYEYTYYGVTIPVNLAYKYAINDELQVIPFTGVYFRGNISAKADYTHKDYGYSPEAGGNYVDDEDSYSLDLFDDDDVEKTWNRFNFGWQIGAKVAYQNFTAGISYGLDLNEIGEKTKMNNLSISVGYNF
jgi:hypothetical protein